MKAVVIHAPHDIRLDDWAVEAPGPDEVQVRIGAGGICGSDLHYYHQGGFGTVRIQHPMVLGHEIAGTVADRGTRRDPRRPGRCGGRQPVGAVRALPLLPGGDAEPLPRHAVLRQRHARRRTCMAASGRC